jgi:hypothetical protein
VLWVIVFATMASMLLAGRMARVRGRSVRAWVWLAAIVGPIGPIALHLLGAPN